MQKNKASKQPKSKKTNKEIDEIIESLIGYDKNSSLKHDQVENMPKIYSNIESEFKKLSTSEIKNQINLITEKFLPGHNVNFHVKNNDIYLMHWNGRFGNRMHTYAYMYNRAKMFNSNIYLPSDWEGTKLFNLNYKIIEDDEYRGLINQSIQPYDSFESRLKATEDYEKRSGKKIKYLNPDQPTESYSKKDHAVVIDSLAAYHKEIFNHMNLSDILQVFEFSDEVKNLDLYKRLEDNQNNYDIAHLRRDDVSNTSNTSNGGYSVVSKDSYIKAFKKFGYDPSKMQWVSDDWYDLDKVGTCITKGYVQARGGWSYPHGAQFLPEIMFDWLPDFLRIYFARSIFRANSSFSFWASTLSRGRETPPKIFAPVLHERILTHEKDSLGKQLDCEFVEGNYPHWMCLAGDEHCNHIIFKDEDIKPEIIKNEK